jgi:hypothetical protein
MPGGPTVSQNGISLNQLAEEIASKYDSNSDGIIRVNTETFLKTESKKAAKIESRGLLFTDADANGNSDGTVSKQELIALLGHFDTDHDGELTSYKSIIHALFHGKSEWAKLEDQYGERYKYEDL